MNYLAGVSIFSLPVSIGNALAVAGNLVTAIRIRPDPRPAARLLRGGNVRRFLIEDNGGRRRSR